MQKIIYTVRRYKSFKAICRLEFISALRRSENIAQLIMNYRESIEDITSAGYSLYMTKKQSLKYFEKAIEGDTRVFSISQHQSNGR